MGWVCIRDSVVCKFMSVIYISKGLNKSRLRHNISKLLVMIGPINKLEVSEI